MARPKKKSNFSELPKGYRALSGGNSWQPQTPGDQIEGIYRGFKEKHLDKRGRMKARDVNVHKIETPDGTIDVWQSAGLKVLESVKKGTSILIRYTGKRVITRGQNPMREFLVATK